MANAKRKNGSNKGVLKKKMRRVKGGSAGAAGPILLRSGSPFYDGFGSKIKLDP